VDNQNYLCVNCRKFVTPINYGNVLIHVCAPDDPNPVVIPDEHTCADNMILVWDDNKDAIVEVCEVCHTLKLISQEQES